MKLNKKSRIQIIQKELEIKRKNIKMKFLVILSILSLSVYITSASLSSDTCNWYNSAKAVIGKLTPQGQKGALKVLQDYQLYAGAAVQPVYDYLGQLYKNEIASVNASDSAQLAKLQVFLGVGNYVILFP